MRWMAIRSIKYVAAASIGYATISFERKAATPADDNFCAKGKFLYP